MKKILITLLIGILIIIAGAGLMIYGYTRDDFSLDQYEMENFEKEEFTYLKEDFSTINFDSEIENFKIIVTEEDIFKIEGKKSENIYYEYKLEDNTLTIKQHWKDKIRLLFSFDETNITSPYIVYVPKDSLKELNVNIKVGSIDINDIIVDKLSVNVKTGDVKIKNVFSKKLDVVCNTGNVDVNANDCININININVGDLELITNQAFDVNLSLNTGKISFEGKINNSGYFKCNVGDVNLILFGNDYNINNTGNGKTKITTDVDLGNLHYQYK